MINGIVQYKPNGASGCDRDRFSSRGRVDVAGNVG